jgi:hypothetical protein
MRFAAGLGEQMRPGDLNRLRVAGQRLFDHLAQRPPSNDAPATMIARRIRKSMLYA